jgi:hypothetical protein
MEDFIAQKVKMLKEGFSHSQIRGEVWSYLLKEYCNTMRLEGIIDVSMTVYADILKRADKK